MTANQAIAMAFPLLTAVAVFLTGLFIRKPWAAKKSAVDSDQSAKLPPIKLDADPRVEGLAEVEEIVPTVDGASEALVPTYGETLDEAERLISRAQRLIKRARTPASQIGITR
jgi:hypothetical protein